MKKFLAIVLAVILCFACVACASNTDKETSDKLTATEGVLVMATNAEFPPYEYKEGDAFAGIDVEIAGAIANKLGLELQLADVEFGSIIGGVQSGKYDMGMAGMTVTEERLQNVNFSSVYAKGVQSVIIPEGSAIASVDDLAGKKIGVQESTTGHIYCEDDFGAEYTFTDHKQMALSSMLHKTHYIYIGTFSKIFAPGIRLGYVCASADIIRQIVDYRSIVDIHGDNTLERAMLELFENGDMNRHIRSAVRVYKERLAFISSEIKRILGKSVEYRKPGGGLAVWMGLGTTKNADTFRAMMLAKGIDIPVFTLDDGSIGVRIGYASMDNSEVTEVLSAIRSVLEL